MSKTYDPKIYVVQPPTPALSPWAETAFSTDATTLPAYNAAGWRETAFSTDAPTTPRARAFDLVEDDWT